MKIHINRLLLEKKVIGLIVFILASVIYTFIIVNNEEYVEDKCSFYNEFEEAKNRRLNQSNSSGVDPAKANDEKLRAFYKKLFLEEAKRDEEVRAQTVATTTPKALKSGKETSRTTTKITSTTTRLTTTAAKVKNLKTCEFSLGNVTDFNNKIDNRLLPFEEVEKELIKKHKIKLERGGISLAEKNHNCYSNKSIAIIVAYRNREENLKIFLLNIHAYLTTRKLNYGIYLIEPEAGLKFNRALLMNIGFLESQRDFRQWNCFIFHDIDMLPLDVRIPYMCDNECPLHMAVARDSVNFTMEGYYQFYFGGVTSFTKEQFETVNGYSNLFFGWGKEDDNLFSRALFKYGRIKKIRPSIGRFHSASHDLQPRNDKREKVYRVLMNRMKKRGEIDEGLTTISYKLRKITKYNLYTNVFVYYNETEILKDHFTKL